MKFKLKIALIVSTVVIVSFGIFRIISVRLLKTEFYDRVIKELSKEALNTMDELDKFLFNRLSDIKVITSRENVILSSSKYGSRKKLNYLRMIESIEKVYASMSIYNVNGICTGDTRNVNIGKNDKYKPFFQEAIKGDIYYDIRPVYSESLGISVMHFSSPLKDEKETIKGVLVSRCSINKIYEIIRKIKGIRKTVLIDLLDKDGLVLFSNHRPKDILRKRLCGLDVFKKISKSQKNIETGMYKYKGREVICACVKEQGYLDYIGNGWLLLLCMDKNIAFAFVNDLRRRTIIYFLVILLLTILTSFLIAVSITKPIEKLIFAAGKIARGDLNYKVKIKSKNEIGMLAGAFNKMTKDLKKTTASRDELSQEIKERKRAEKSLKESEKKFRTLIESSVDGIIITDVETGKFKYTNPSFCKLLGYSKKEVKTLNISEMHPKDKKDYVLSKFEAHLKREIVAADNLPFLKKDGTIIYVDITGPIVFIDGKRCSIGFVRDITQKKKMQENLIKIQKLESVGTLAGGIAHDFNNLLTSIMGNLSLVKIDVPKRDKKYESLAEMEKSALDAKKLSNKLLTLSRGGEPVIKVISIKSVLKDTVKSVLKETDTGCEFNIPDNLWQVMADETQIRVVIDNIVTNACESMQNAGKVFVTAQNNKQAKENDLQLLEGDYVKVFIKDMGMGILKKNLKKIFDPYFTTKQDKSGLGLTVSYSIIKKHNGKIIAESETGDGAAFIFYLPASVKGDSDKKKKDKIYIGKGKILVMDDDLMVQKSAGRILTRLGYDVEIANDGEEAVEMYKNAQSSHPFDAVIMDLTIPGRMGGKEAVKKLKQIDPGVIAVVSSGYSNDPVMAMPEKYHFQDVLPKPYTIHEISRILEKVLKM